MPSLCLLLTTLGRPTLPRMLESVRRQKPPAGVSVLVASDDRHDFVAECLRSAGVPGTQVVFPHGPHPPYGHRLRNALTHQIEADYVWHVDDDDVLLPGGLTTVLDAIVAAPAAFHLVPFLRATDGAVVGRTVAPDEVGTPNFVHPVAGVRLGVWGEASVRGDYEFISRTVGLNPDRRVAVTRTPAYLAYPAAGWTLDECWADPLPRRRRP